MRLLFLILIMSTWATPLGVTPLEASPVEATPLGVTPLGVSPDAPLQKSLAQGAPSSKGAAVSWARGVQAFQQKNFKQAALHFSQAAKLQPQNAAIVYNGALSEYQIGQPAKAAALWRRALKIDPWFGAARQALAWLHNSSPPKGLGVPEPARAFDWWHQKVLTYLPLGLLLGLLWGLLLTVLVWGWRISYRTPNPFGCNPFGRNPFGRNPFGRNPFGCSPYGIFALVMGGLLILLIGVKSYDLSLKRATLVGPDLSVQTAPDEGANILFQARAGQQVVVQRYTKDWLLCARNGRPLGWLARDSVLVH